MRIPFRTFALSAICVSLLTACGSSTPNSSGVDAQSKQLHRSDKAQASDYATILQQLYIAYYGRPGDPGGMAYWEGVLLASGAPTDLQDLASAYATNTAVKTVINSFGNSAESVALYGTGNSTAFVTAIYNNVLGRAPDQAGLNYWAGLLSAGQVTQAQVAMAILAAAAAEPSSSSDEQLVSNRLSVANYFSSQLTAQNAASTYSGNAANASIRTMLDGVTASTDITAYQATANLALGGMIGVPAVEAFVGNMGSAGYANGTGAAAHFVTPTGVAADNAGNLYVTETCHIRKITPAGATTMFAGFAGCGYRDGPVAAAEFSYLSGIAVDSTGNVFVVDPDTSVIRKISSTGVVSTFAGTAYAMGSADGVGAAARFNYPQGIATDSAGNVYVADTNNNTIRKITPTGTVSTLAGTPGLTLGVDGQGAAAGFVVPWGVATDGAGNVYVADWGGQNIRKITPTGLVTTLAGMPNSGDTGYADGAAPAARFSFPRSLTVDSYGTVYVADTGNNCIRLITSLGVVGTLAGNAPHAGSADGSGTAASFNYPYGITTDSAGYVYVSDSYNNTIRKITPGGTTSTMAGTAEIEGGTDATGSEASFNFPTYEQWRGPSWAFIVGIVKDSAGNLFVADTNNNTIRKITPAGAVSTFAGVTGYTGTLDGLGTNTLFNAPTGLAIDSADNLYVADTGNNTIRMITPAGQVTTLAGFPGYQGSWDGQGAAARFNYPQGLAVDRAGNIYVADSQNSTIRKITPAGLVSTLAGTAGIFNNKDGTGAAASFYGPSGLVVDSLGNLYVADSTNNRIRKVTPAGVVTTPNLTTTPTAANGYNTYVNLNFPSGITIDTAGNLFVADTLNHRIAMITPAGAVTSVAGTYGNVGFVAGAQGGLAFPSGLALNGSKLYVTTEQGVAVVSNVP
ncbi:MAG: DUF4214 domain-containing protein [Burkholderiaceae bacterium]|nr:DUF4214 domain-containing protein [Burkholderiaceae bacterium]